MKSILLSLLTAVSFPAAAPLFAQTVTNNSNNTPTITQSVVSTPNDTIVKVIRPDSVIVTESDSVTHITIRGKEDNPDYLFDLDVQTGKNQLTTMHERATRWDFSLSLNKKGSGKESRTMLTFGGFHFGFVNALNAPKGMKIDMASSYEIGFQGPGYCVKTNNRKHHFSVGLGFNWRNFRMTGRTRFLQTPNGSLITSPYPQNTTDIKSSRIKLFSLTVPFGFTFGLAKDWEAQVATILNFNTFASVESRYSILETNTETGESFTRRVKDHSNNVHQKPVSVDFMASLRWRMLGVYAKYSPCKVLNPEFSPSFTPVSVGFTIWY